MTLPQALSKGVVHSCVEPGVNQESDSESESQSSSSFSLGPGLEIACARSIFTCHVGSTGLDGVLWDEYRVKALPTPDPCLPILYSPV